MVWRKLLQRQYFQYLFNRCPSRNVPVSYRLMSNQVAMTLKVNEASGSSVQRKSTSPKKICNLTTQKFIDIIDTATFVDKSLFIKAFLEANDSVIVALAPKGFGKSTNMDMLKEFLTGNKGIFEKNQLKIWKEERTFFDVNCQKNPIIHLDFKSVGGKTEDEILGSMKSVLQNAYDYHNYLVNKSGSTYGWSHEKLKGVDCTCESFIKYLNQPQALSREEVIAGFKRLSQCLYVYHGKPVYVLIDEYDTPIMNATLKTNAEQNILHNTMNLISVIMGDLLKGNKYVKGGLINACVPVAFHHDNYIEYYEFLSKRFVDYYGFTAQEVEDLFKREEFVTFRNDDKIKQWYNGYQRRDKDAAIYNNYSILRYLKRSNEEKEQTFGSYWVGTGSITNMKALFAKFGIRELVEKLINGEEIEIRVVQKWTEEDVQAMKVLVHGNSDDIYIKEAHLFIQFLAHNGYLNVIKNDIFSSIVKVPNEEIETLLIQKCYNVEFVREKYDLKPKKIKNYTDAICSVLEYPPSDSEFISLANAVSDLFDKCKMPIDDCELHCILFTLLYNVKLYHARSEFNVERIKKLGRPQHLTRHLDILVILGCVGMIIVLNSANESLWLAHKQSAKCSAVFDKPAYKNVTMKIYVGLRMDKEKKVTIAYTVGNNQLKSVASSNVV